MFGGAALLLFAAQAGLSEIEQRKIDALGASGASIRVQVDDRGSPEVWVDFNKKIADDALRPLRNFTRVTTLRILSGDITDAGLDHLVGVDRLWLLVLKSDRLTDGAALRVSKLKSIRKLDFMGAQLSKRGLGAIAKMPALEQLYLHGARLSEGATKSLRGMTRLRDLTVSKNLPPTEFAELKRALPKVRIGQF